MSTNGAFRGTQTECQRFLREGPPHHYVYVLRRPDGRPFYVGKGLNDRVFSHENEARHPNGRRSNAYKLNVIRSMWREGAALQYEIDLVTPDEAIALAREAELIGFFKRLHEGGPLTNLAPGGGSTRGFAPSSKARHSATLSGAPADNPERAVLNHFVLGIASMRSVVIKPLSQFVARPTQPYPSKSMSATLRQAAALVASASANGIPLSGPAEVPRHLTVDDVDGLVENGVACDIITSGLGALVPATLPADERFNMSESQARAVVGLVGWQKCIDLGVLPTTALRA